MKNSRHSTKFSRASGDIPLHVLRTVETLALRLGLVQQGLYVGDHAKGSGHCFLAGSDRRLAVTSARRARLAAWGCTERSSSTGRRLTQPHGEVPPTERVVGMDASRLQLVEASGQAAQSTRGSLEGSTIEEAS